jgi:oligopeptide transport system permease protein
MTRFVLRRLAWMVLTLWVVLTSAFFLMRAVKGGPFDDERALAPAIEEQVRARYHLDWPLWRQYLAYVGPLNLDEHRARALGGDGTDHFGGVLAGDLGPSFKYRDLTVNEILAQSLPISLTLGVLALGIALAIGLPAGILSALRRGTALDVGLRLAATTGIALPNFVIAGVLVLLFVFALPLFPVAGWGGPRHLVLPALVLGLPFAAYVARLARTALLETLAQDWIRTARAKGLPERLVVLRHALPNALLPVISFLGPATAGILTGSLVVERLFAIPGTGSHFVNGALNRDYTLAMGVTLLYTALVCVLNLLVDLAYGWIDPRLAERRA